MKEFTYKTKYFHKDLFDSPNAVIVDNEIENDISPNWIYKNGKPVVVGMLYQDKIVVIAKEGSNDNLFKEKVDYELKFKPKADLYAFNKHMELGNFEGMGIKDIEIKEIMPFRGRGWNKERFWNELIARERIPNINLPDVFGGDASLCVEYYRRYQVTGKQEFLMKIVEHNINCLLKESVILKNKDWFRQNYPIDEKGGIIA